MCQSNIIHKCIILQLFPFFSFQSFKHEFKNDKTFESDSVKSTGVLAIEPGTFFRHLQADMYVARGIEINLANFCKENSVLTNELLVLRQPKYHQWII